MLLARMHSIPCIGHRSLCPSPCDCLWGTLCALSLAGLGTIRWEVSAGGSNG